MTNITVSEVEHYIQSLEEVVGVSLFSTERTTTLKNLLSKKKRILTHIEETLIQNIRAIWIKEGDENTRYFHTFSKRRKITNSVWEEKDDEDSLVFYQGSIKLVAKN